MMMLYGKQLPLGERSRKPQAGRPIYDLRGDSVNLPNQPDHSNHRDNLADHLLTKANPVPVAGYQAPSLAIYDPGSTVA
jgi:hypothetical protein